MKNKTTSGRNAVVSIGSTTGPSADAIHRSSARGAIEITGGIRNVVGVDNRGACRTYQGSRHGRTDGEIFRCIHGEFHGFVLVFPHSRDQRDAPPQRLVGQAGNS